MADPTQYTFTHREVVEALIRKQDLHEGHWGLYVEFGISGLNVGPTEEQLVPAALVPVVKLGLQMVEPGKSLPGTVDAAAINPRTARPLRDRLVGEKSGSPPRRALRGRSREVGGTEPTR